MHLEDPSKSVGHQFSCGFLGDNRTSTLLEFVEWCAITQSRTSDEMLNSVCIITSPHLLNLKIKLAFMQFLCSLWSSVYSNSHSMLYSYQALFMPEHCEKFHTVNKEIFAIPLLKSIVFIRRTADHSTHGLTVGQQKKPMADSSQY